MDTISSYIWSEKFWFPPGIGWGDLENHPDTDVYLPQYSDMLWSFPLGLLLLAFRFVFERGFVVHVARWLGVKEKKRELKPQPVLEVWYQQNGVISNNNLESVSKQTDLRVREIERWLRDRKALSKPCVIKKIQECSWHFVFYISSFTGGLIVLLNKPWFWKTELCWKNWPKIIVDTVDEILTNRKHDPKVMGLRNLVTDKQVVAAILVLCDLPQPVNIFCKYLQGSVNFAMVAIKLKHIDNDVYWYYLIELSFYWCLVFSMVTDHKRKDFGQMIVHHIATILLVYFSWVVNFVPIGTLTLLTHDAADFPMAAAKMFKYSGYKKMCEACIGVFAVVWILSRLMYYPFVVLYSSSVELFIHLEPFWSHYFFIGLLIVLQILHLIWSYYISKIVYGTMFQGKVEDIRSDSESD